MPHAYTEEQLVEQAAIGLLAELLWQVAGPPPEATTAAVDELTGDRSALRLLPGAVNLKTNGDMSQRLLKSSNSAAALPADYAPFLANIKARVQSARLKAGLAANRELLAPYWDIGRLILDRQRREGWGAKVIDRLAEDLQRAFPGQQGFSPRNLVRWRGERATPAQRRFVFILIGHFNAR